MVKRLLFASFIVAALAVIVILVVHDQRRWAQAQKEIPHRSREELERRKKSDAANLAAFLKTPAGKVCGAYSTWSREDCQLIAEHRLRVGMTASEVQASWGQPRKINSTTTARGSSEQWVYDDDRLAYLDNGILTALQESR